MLPMGIVTLPLQIEIRGGAGGLNFSCSAP